MQLRALSPGGGSISGVTAALGRALTSLGYKYRGFALSLGGHVLVLGDVFGVVPLRRRPDHVLGRLWGRPASPWGHLRMPHLLPWVAPRWRGSTDLSRVGAPPPWGSFFRFWVTPERPVPGRDSPCPSDGGYPMVSGATGLQAPGAALPCSRSRGVLSAGLRGASSPGLFAVPALKGLTELSRSKYQRAPRRPSVAGPGLAPGISGL